MNEPLATQKMVALMFGEVDKYLTEVGLPLTVEQRSALDAAVQDMAVAS